MGCHLLDKCYSCFTWKWPIYSRYAIKIDLCFKPHGAYQSSVNQEYGENMTSHPVIDEELWKEATGAIKKCRIYDFGYSGDPILTLTEVPAHGYAGGASSSDVWVCTCFSFDVYIFRK